MIVSKLDKMKVGDRTAIIINLTSVAIELYRREAKLLNLDYVRI